MSGGGPRWADRLRRLGAHDAGARVFGADTHRYFLCPPLSPAALEAIEERAGTPLPSNYRRFVGEVTGGGVGPGYGLRWLGAALLPLDLDPDGWVAAAEVEVFDTAVRRAWRDANLSTEVPAPVSLPAFLPPSARGPTRMRSARSSFLLNIGREMRELLHGDRLTDLRTPFALEAPLNAASEIGEIEWGALDHEQTEAELQRLWRRIGFDRAYQGSLPLCSYGHRTTARLVVHGQGAGSVWIVDAENLAAAPFGPDHHDLHGSTPRPPSGPNFESWLHDWLECVEGQLGLAL